MNIDLLFKIAGVGILVAVLHQVLSKAGREDQAMMTTLARLGYCSNNCNKRNKQLICYS
jgi:stage III sporulation protein AC